MMKSTIETVAIVALASLALACGDDATTSDSGTAGTEGTTAASGTTASTNASNSGSDTASSQSGSETGGMTDATSAGPTTSGSPTTTPQTSDATISTSDATVSTTDATDATATGSSGGTETTGQASGETTGPPPPMCGNGVVEMGEECDDGNMIDDDACANDCTKVPCDEQMGGGGEELSYIWISNSGQGTVSKINTMTAIEEGRYAVAGGSPSRTSVNLEGDVAISSRDPGAITKILGNVENCPDSNNNGQVDTSSGPNDVLPFGQDECVAWSRNIASPGYSAGPRATAWQGSEPDPDTCQYPTPNLWIAWRDGGGTAHIELVDGITGDIIQNIDYPGWGTGYAPYGGAVNAEGDFFFTGLGDLPSIMIDSETFQVVNLGQPPNPCKYGMTLDLNGDLWAGDYCNTGIHYYDSEAQQWTNVGGGGGQWILGVMADADGNVWGAGVTPCRLVQVDVETKTFVNNNIALPGCSQPWGVSIDSEGDVWVVDKANKAYEVDPDTYQVKNIVMGLVAPYTYSDMTGVALKNQVVPQ